MQVFEMNIPPFTLGNDLYVVARRRTGRGNSVWKCLTHSEGLLDSYETIEEAWLAYHMYNDAVGENADAVIEITAKGWKMHHFGAPEAPSTPAECIVGDYVDAGSW